MILAEDESRVNLLPWLRSTWIVNGDRQEVMTPGTNEKRSDNVGTHSSRAVESWLAAHARVRLLYRTIVTWMPIGLFVPHRSGQCQRRRQGHDADRLGPGRR